VAFKHALRVLIKAPTSAKELLGEALIETFVCIRPQLEAAANSTNRMLPHRFVASSNSETCMRCGEKVAMRSES
jgi:hypothetical protein